ncbi:MAG TPA: hypothetical protein VFI31_14135 [Pirellulales bacterium]|nr:hypothetical protein [Pirellulales bacterium]
MDENPYKAPADASEPFAYWRLLRLYAVTVLFVGMVILNIVMARMGRGIAVFFQ